MFSNNICFIYNCKKKILPQCFFFVTLVSGVLLVPLEVSGSPPSFSFPVHTVQYAHIIQALNHDAIILYCWCWEELWSFVKQKKEMENGILEVYEYCIYDWFSGFLSVGSGLRLKVFDVIWESVTANVKHTED